MPGATVLNTVCLVGGVSFHSKVILGPATVNPSFVEMFRS
jgi:hypothetical protein